MALSDQDLANKLRSVASSAQPKITRSGNVLYITIDGTTYTLQRQASRVTRSQGVKSR